MYCDDAGNTFLPGYGRPLKDCAPYYTDSQLFPNAFDPPDEYGGPACERLITRRELMMQGMMDEMTDRQDWEKLVTTRLKVEDFYNWGKFLDDRARDISPKMMFNVWCELKYKARISFETGIIPVLDGRVAKSDVIVPRHYRAAFLEAVKPLEDVPNKQKDWQPGSANTVLNLVDSSLFPLVYGLSQIHPSGCMTIEEGRKCGDGVVIPVPPEEPMDGWKQPCSWIGYVNIRGERARITSYINNLHPQHHKSLYGLIEQLIDYAILLWDMVLTAIQDPDSLIRRVEYKKVEYETYEDFLESEWPQREDGEDEYMFASRKREWLEINRLCIQPEPEDFQLTKVTNPLRLREKYKEYGLQVVVKLTNIGLAPDKPTYVGRSWRLVGQMNEHIVAVAFYAYSNENITTPRELNFRYMCEVRPLEKLRYDLRELQGHNGSSDWLEDIFAFETHRADVQNLGTVKISEGRLVSFPNTLQHQVQHFHLEDPKKPGHSKIVALFLVDPAMKIISTANFPCQRKDWWYEELEDVNALSKLPPELRNMVVNEVEFPSGMEKAKKLRLERIKERRAFVEDHTRDVFESIDVHDYEAFLRFKCAHFVPEDHYNYSWLGPQDDE